VLEVRSSGDRAASTIVDWQMSAFLDPPHPFPPLSPPYGHYRGRDEGEVTVFHNTATCHPSQGDDQIPHPIRIRGYQLTLASPLSLTLQGSTCSDLLVVWAELCPQHLFSYQVIRGLGLRSRTLSLMGPIPYPPWTKPLSAPLMTAAPYDYARYFQRCIHCSGLVSPH